MWNSEKPLTCAGVSVLALLAVGVVTRAAAEGSAGTVIDGSATASTTPESVGTSGILASLPIPPNYVQARDAEVVVDGSSAQLVRFVRADGRNAGLGGEHFSALVDSSGTLRGFTRMDLALHGGPLPDEQEARTIAMRFLSAHAPDLLPNLQISFIAPHHEPIVAENGTVTVTGMKVKMRNVADGRWAWVIVGSDLGVMVFERDIVWANLEGRRTTELWLHDRWLAQNGNWL